MSIKKSLVAGKNLYKVTFSHPVSAVNGKKNVLVLGDFNQWDSVKGLPMKAGKTDLTASVELAAGTYEFRYLIDNTTWENDHDADNYTSSPFAGIQNSVLHLPAVEAKQPKVKASAPAADKKVVAKKETAANAKAVKTAAPVAKKEAKAADKVVKAAKAPAKAAPVKAEPKTKAAPKAAAKAAKK